MFAQTPRLLRGGVDISSNMVDHIYQDREGLVWISTENGLNRMDGAKNTVLTSVKDNTSTFLHVMQDNRGRHWVSGSDGVLLYNNATEEMEPISAYLADGSIAIIHPTMTLQRKDGTILTCCEGQGVFELREKDGKLSFHQIIKHGVRHYVRRILEDRDGFLWICSENGIEKCNGKKHITVDCGNPEKNRYFSSIIDGADGNIWASNDAGGVWKINPKTLKAEEVKGLSDVPVHCLLMNYKSALLAGTNGRGVLAIDSKTLEIKQFHLQTGHIADDRINIHAIAQDLDGNLLIGCYQKGVVIHPRLENRFRYVGRMSQTMNLIGNNCVMSLSMDKSGTLWIAGDGDGLYGMKGQNIKHLPASGTMPKTIMAQYCDSKGNVWLGTWMQGLWKMDPSTGAVTKVQLPMKNSNCSVFGFAEDGNGKLWIGTQAEGLLSMDLKSGEFKTAPKTVDSSNADYKRNMIPNMWVNSLCMGKDNIMYIATCDGLGAIDVKTGNCLRGLKGKNRILGGTNIITLCYSEDDRLWIGTKKGLYCLNVKTMELKLYSNADGLAGNTIQSIVNDGKGSLWISTNVGISCFSLKDASIIGYSSANGMQGNEFSKNAVVYSKEGQLYFGGTAGLTIFRPEALTSSSSKPHLFITGFYLNGKAVNTLTMSGGEKILDVDIIHVQNINLAYDDNNFTVELSTMNYMSTDNVSYEYKIDGGEWERLPLGTNTVSFSNMKPGKYRLSFRVRNQDGLSEERELIVSIRSPWYTSWWAWLVYLALAAIIAYFLLINIRQRQRSQLRELEMMKNEEISEAKLQFFMNISHEIRTPMTLIVSPLQRLISSDKDPERQSAYKLINRNAQRILQLVNQLLDVRKIDKGQMKLYFREVDVVQYVRNIVDGFKELCDTKKIEISFESNKETQMAWIDPLNFDKIVVNLLSNAFKYTPKEGRVSVCLMADDASYSIRVEDSGSGIDEQQISHIFERFYQQNNATNNSIQGSGIGLNLTRSLVLLHHGEIEVANNGEGKPGCHFVVTMPLGKEHLTEADIDNSVDSMVVANGEAAESEVPNVNIVASAVASQTPTDTEPLTGKRPKTRKRLLVVEDDSEISLYLREELGKDFSVQVCQNGEEGLHAIRVRQPDIIISDVMMPVMDGISMLKEIRQNTTMNNIPVILLTAKTTEQDNIEGLEMGADAYITKPFNIELLRRTALNLVSRHDQLRNIFNGSQNPEIQDKVKVVSPDERLMQRIMKVVNANLSNPNLNNDLLTREVGISRVHLYRKLKELTNLSIRDFIRNIRLAEAARLLSEQHHSISEVAEKTGFDNVSYFAVIFKQKYGVPPSRYAESLKEGAAELADAQMEEAD